MISRRRRLLQRDASLRARRIRGVSQRDFGVSTLAGRHGRLPSSFSSRRRAWVERAANESETRRDVASNVADCETRRPGANEWDDERHEDEPAAGERDSFDRKELSTNAAAGSFWWLESKSHNNRRAFGTGRLHQLRHITTPRVRLMPSAIMIAICILRLRSVRVRVNVFELAARCVENAREDGSSGGVELSTRA